MFSFRMLSLIGILIALLVVCSLPSFGEENPQEGAAPSEQVGRIKISSIPPGAKVKLDGKRIGITPMILHGVPEGSHVVRLSLRGYPDYVTRINSEKGRDSEMNIALPKKVYFKWIEQYSQAITSSIVLPGKGQIDHGHTRGWYYFLAYFGTAGYTIYQANAYSSSESDFNNALERYHDENTTPEEVVRRFRNVTRAREDMIRHKDNYDLGLKTAIGIWAINMIDVVFFTVDRPVIYASNPQTFALYTNPIEKRIGLRLNF